VGLAAVSDQQKSSFTKQVTEMELKPVDAIKKSQEIQKIMF
jgi:hypothetical protein